MLGAAQRQALALVFLQAHSYGYVISRNVDAPNPREGALHKLISISAQDSLRTDIN